MEPVSPPAPVTGSGGGDKLQAVTVLDGSGSWIRGEVFAPGGADGRHTATYLNGTGGTTYFDYSDWLGQAARAAAEDAGLAATVNGTEQDACASLPFGDDFNCTGPGADPSPLHFTGQQHDDETGLDHFSARNYTSAWGLWTTPDWSSSPAAVPYASLSDPQSLNLYTYTLDNPETNTGPDGHWCFIGIGTTCAHKKVKGGPKVAGPGWMTRCEGNSLCAGAILAGLVQAALAVQQARQVGQSFKERPYICGALFGLSLFVGPEAEEAGMAAEEGAVARDATEGVADGKITGFTRHGINQAIGRDDVGVADRSILDAVRNPTEVIQQSGGRTMYVGKDATVITNAEGKVVTTWANSSAGARIP